MTDNEDPDFDLATGLVNFYSSQADLMLAQYENINQLLGPTKDWTHPGTLCEELVRHFLRRFMLPHMSIDKGYVYGRTNIDGRETHCPEIDILIHDTQRFRPVFRMGDFVIVQPDAVLAMIQIKRTMTPGQLHRGIQNITQAKQHLINMLQARGHQGLPPIIFSGVLAFEDNVKENVSLYQRYLLEYHLKYRAYDRERQIETSMYVLPMFMGSLKGCFVSRPRPNINFSNQEYVACASNYKYKDDDSKTLIRNVALQWMLYLLTNTGRNVSDEPPPFAFPLGMKPFHKFSVLPEEK